MVISTWIDSLDWQEATQKIILWAKRREPRTVCICNVHSVVTARSNIELREAINSADLATPDGMPVAWLLSWRRKIRQERINGPDLTLSLCREAALEGVGVAFFGGSPTALERLGASLQLRIPQLRISTKISPPYRTLSTSEAADYVKQLNESGAGIIFVGLGCPKQEIWMAKHKEELNAVLIGVGAAFDYIAGTVRRPPLWMQRTGLEWFGRLIAEPKRLWWRYLSTNSAFIIYVADEFRRLKRNK